MCVTETARIPREQKFWLVLHWIALVLTVYLVVAAISGGAEAYSVLIVVLALLATVLALVFATRIARLRLSTPRFVKLTTTGRVIAAGWTFIGLLLFVVPILSLFFELDITNSAWTSGVIGAVGSVSLLAMIGPGYSDFREALAPKDAD